MPAAPTTLDEDVKSSYRELRAAKRFARNPQLHAFVRGVTAAATGAIAGAVVVLARRAVYDWVTVAIALITAALLFRWKIPEPILIVAAAAVGLMVH